MPSRCWVPDGTDHNVIRKDLQDRDVRELVYIESYVAHIFKKEPKCSVCASKLSSDKKLDTEIIEDRYHYLWVLDRGALKWLSEFTVSSRSSFFKFCTASPSNFEDKFLDLSN